LQERRRARKALELKKAAEDRLTHEQEKLVSCCECSACLSASLMQTAGIGLCLRWRRGVVVSGVGLISKLVNVGPG